MALFPLKGDHLVSTGNHINPRGKRKGDPFLVALTASISG
jgi:hypothetical protein